MRTIAPSGFLHSFEFNEIRATRAQEEFEENALGEFTRKKTKATSSFFFAVDFKFCLFSDEQQNRRIGARLWRDACTCGHQRLSYFVAHII